MLYDSNYIRTLLHLPMRPRHTLEAALLLYGGEAVCGDVVKVRVFVEHDVFAKGDDFVYLVPAPV